MDKKWHEILEDIEIVEENGEKEVWSKEQLLYFEQETGVLLPEQYKVFCELFGTGYFGDDCDYVRIECPHPNSFEIFIISIKKEIEWFPGSAINGDIKNDKLLQELFDNAFVFGDTPCSNIFFWDLRTYNSLDDSYDIYLANSDCFEGVYWVGRDFYEFIHDFCLGTQSWEILPKFKEIFPKSEVKSSYPILNVFTRYSHPDISKEQAEIYRKLYL